MSRQAARPDRTLLKAPRSYAFYSIRANYFSPSPENITNGTVNGTVNGTEPYRLFFPEYRATSGLQNHASVPKFA
ncbi:hypothetical protein, partial [Paramuribaculum intestinale]|uniref:hypothetical protein n=1 Tax=Paramuribaculum intestinale TaxID=2094151 RepID=UPI00272A455B